MLQTLRERSQKRKKLLAQTVRIIPDFVLLRLCSFKSRVYKRYEFVSST